MKYQGFSMIRFSSSKRTMSTKTYPGQSLRVETVFFWFRTSTTFSIGTRTSFTKSPISSVLMRFSMLSLTFCSWPDKVWITNHWLRMIKSWLRLSDPANQHRKDKIHTHRKAAQQQDGNPHHHRRAFQLVPTRPGAFAQFFTRLLHVIGEAHQVARPPEPGEHATNHCH